MATVRPALRAWKAHSDQKRERSRFFRLPPHGRTDRMRENMRILHYDCRAGVSGDMNLGAMAALGVPLAAMQAELELLGLPPDSLRLEAKEAMRGGVAGTEITVHAPCSPCENGHGHRSWADIREMIRRSELSHRVKEDALSVFGRLAEAEAGVHGRAADEVEFHEVGSLDSIADIVGAAFCWEWLGVDAITCSEIELGGGTVHCAHGTLSVPAPATVRLARGMLVSLGGTDHEAATPTGVALMAAKARQERARGRLIASGTGLGHRDSRAMPNALRVCLLETETRRADRSDAVLLEANLDDMSPEHLAYAVDKLFEAGASDAWQEAIVMKKGRLAACLRALCPPEREEAVRDCIFRHTSTLGLRMVACRKYELPRRSKTVEAGGRNFRIKLGGTDGSRSKIEFDDLRRAADETGSPLQEILERVLPEAKGGDLPGCPLNSGGDGD